EWVNVSIQGTERGASTDGSGYYCVQVPAGTWTAFYTRAGYFGTKSQLHVEEGCSTRLDTDLRPVSAPTSIPGSPKSRNEVRTFHKRIVRLGGPASYPETRIGESFDATHLDDPLLVFLDDPHWYACDPHPFLTSALPGVSFAMVSSGSWRAGSSMLCGVTSDGRVYQKADLNSLLLADGYSFDSTEMQTIAKIAVLLQHFTVPSYKSEDFNRRIITAEDFQRGDSRPPEPPKPPEVAGFPSVTFTTFTREVREIPYGTRSAANTRLTVVCRVNGVEETTAVDFHGTTDGRNSLEGISSPHRYSTRYQPGRGPEPNSSPPSK
ncbi:MAG: hypothetical protein NTX53_20930, partial [candidate division WOR-3 bacterium]|nr:hypothetical protein [candidate division WOR-3 bacterium]